MSKLINISGSFINNDNVINIKETLHITFDNIKEHWEYWNDLNNTISVSSYLCDYIDDKINHYYDSFIYPLILDDIKQRIINKSLSVDSDVSLYNALTYEIEKFNILVSNPNCNFIMVSRLVKKLKQHNHNVYSAIYDDEGEIIFNNNIIGILIK